MSAATVVPVHGASGFAPVISALLADGTDVSGEALRAVEGAA
ncbi:hypothetical protein [Actinokineospora sp. PR83]|nr:hypothetical protein [Actinokineospora sp. PR83]